MNATMVVLVNLTVLVLLPKPENVMALDENANTGDHGKAGIHVPSRVAKELPDEQDRA